MYTVISRPHWRSGQSCSKVVFKPYLQSSSKQSCAMMFQAKGICFSGIPKWIFQSGVVWLSVFCKALYIHIDKIDFDLEFKKNFFFFLVSSWMNEWNHTNRLEHYTCIIEGIHHYKGFHTYDHDKLERVGVLDSITLVHKKRDGWDLIEELSSHPFHFSSFLTQINKLLPWLIFFSFAFRSFQTGSSKSWPSLSSRKYPNRWLQMTIFDKFFMKLQSIYYCSRNSWNEVIGKRSRIQKPCFFPVRIGW